MKAAALLSCFGFAALIGCSSDSSTQQAVYNLNMTTAAETPVCAAAGASATGTAAVTVAADNSTIAVNVVYSGLSGAATAAHIHFGTATAPGPVVLPFTGALDSPYTKTFTAADYVPATGAPADFASFVTALRGGGASYVNVHTTACGPGEIRAEIQ
jgi:hypothetical protein